MICNRAVGYLLEGGTLLRVELAELATFDTELDVIAASHLEPVYGSVLHEVASLLQGAIDQQNGNLPRALLGDALAIANSAWNVCAHNEQPLPDTSDNWVGVAINRTSGHLMDFYFDALRFVWQTRDQEQQLIQSIPEALREMIEGDSPASEIARVLVPANALMLAAMAPDWYEAHVLPLLSATAFPRSSEQSWDGYLFWGDGHKKCCQLC